MDDDKALLFYEKLYFHELDSREKLTARLQLSLAILTALIALLAYVVSRASLKGDAGPLANAAFLVSMACGVVLLTTAASHFIKALWGHSYECLPLATEIEEYRALLTETYKEYADGERLSTEHQKKFLVRYFAECAAMNAAVNQKRYKLLHDSISYTVYSLPALILLSLAFTLGGFAHAA
jgi:hypothetical protein